MLLAGSSARFNLVSCESANVFVELTFHFRAPLRSPEYILARHCQRNNTPVVCHTAFHEFTRITSIRPFLSSSSTAKLVAFTIMSRLDYCCNAAFAGVANAQIARVHTDVAWLVLNKNEGCSCHTVLKELSPLVKYRIQYKLATLAFCDIDYTHQPYLTKWMNQNSFMAHKNKNKKLPYKTSSQR